MHRKKGFTLVELLAVIVVLSLLIVIVTVSITKALNNSKMSIYKVSVTRLARAVGNEIIGNEKYAFNDKEYLVVPFASIDMDNTLNLESPFGEYNKNKSFVLVAKESGSFDYKYYVSAIDDKGYGIELSDVDNIKVVENPITLDITRKVVEDGVVVWNIDLPSDVDNEDPSVVAINEKIEKIKEGKTSSVVTSYEFSSVSTLNLKVGDYITYKPEVNSYSVVGGDNGTGVGDLEAFPLKIVKGCDCSSCESNVTNDDIVVNDDGTKKGPSCCECNSSYICENVKSTQTLSTIPDIKYRIYNINDDGSIEIIPEINSLINDNNQIYLRGAAGFNHSVNILDDAAKILYSNSSIGAVARSIDMTDIESKANFPYFNSTADDEPSNGYTYGYKTSTNLTNGKTYPSIWLLDSNKRSNVGYSISEIEGGVYSYSLKNGAGTLTQKPQNSYFYNEQQPPNKVVGKTGLPIDAGKKDTWRFTLNRYLYGYSKGNYPNVILERNNNLPLDMLNATSSGYFALATRYYELDPDNVIKTNIKCADINNLQYRTDKSTEDTNIYSCDKNTADTKYKNDAEIVCKKLDDVTGECNCFAYDENGVCLKKFTLTYRDGVEFPETETSQKLCTEFDSEGNCTRGVQGKDTFDTLTKDANNFLRIYREFPHLYILRYGGKIQGLGMYNADYQTNRCHGLYLLPVITLGAHLEFIDSGGTINGYKTYNIKDLEPSSS